MKKVVVFMLSLVIVFSSFTMVSAAAIKIPKAKIKIDGKEKDWKKIKKNSVTKSIFGSKLDYPWWVKIAHNGKDTIYLRAQVKYPSSIGPYSIKPANSPSWFQDDVIEFWVMNKMPESSMEYKLITKNTHYAWSSKYSFAAKDVEGLLATKATKTKWFNKPSKAEFGIESSIKLKDAKMKKAIKKGKSLYIAIGYECNSGGAENSLYMNGSTGVDFWESYGSVRKVTFSKK